MINEETTIGQIVGEYSAKAAELTKARHERVDELGRQLRPEGPEHLLDRMTDEQRLALLRDQRRDAAAEDRSGRIAELRAAHGNYARALEARKSELQRRLFGVEAPESAGLLAQAALADDDGLRSLLDTAAQSGNTDLGRAAFLTAHRRGLGDLVNRYFQEVDESARAPYAELSEAPSTESVQRQREDITKLLPDADPALLAGRATANL